ncbi:MAG: ribonuclease Y [Defluviitaleaceae bacterium]|nr:ribonuclease Y [Defluviitaleaceae bacterium]
MWQVVVPIIVGVVALLFGVFLGFIYRKKTAEKLKGTAEQEAENIKEEARREALVKKKEILLEAKEESIKTKNEIEKEAKERRAEAQKLERRLMQKEETLDRKTNSFEKKEEQLQKKMENLEQKTQDAEAVLARHSQELERISGLSAEAAKDLLLDNIRNEVKAEAAIMIKDIEAKAKLDADKKAKDVLATAIQRCAVDHVTETSVSVVQLPNDEMKGRIIGREGRNIRTLESLTGIDLIIDDTPEAVILSGFDPVRREIAKVALEKLVADGRVHPARIEEMVEKAKKEVEATIREEGEAATLETGVHGVHSDLIRLLGKMKFRTSYGQNVLRHSIEVSHLCGLLAGEMGLDVTLAKRAGLLHDIGKAIDHENEGSHIVLGAQLLRKHRENEVVVNACESHHGDVEATSVISVLVMAADAISAARPGARRETLESYIKRLTKLEEIANSFDGVEKTYAIQAGRELRLAVIPEVVDDNSMTLLARDVAKRIENELEYPGNIKISLIRETRVVEYAK